ncbi:TolC family protein [Spirosoma sp.]|uniref:TolC family protein n=1 Tax=Spirosoma sp. TaxID=1899569 RepID=UPI0026061FB5|nr:TolC family protein [Spirosoma sp.]MCX6215695.1 TolC family protein [Spirosoma sp.]
MNLPLKLSFFSVLLTGSAIAQTTQPLQLKQVQDQAVQQNRRLKIARYKVDESDYKIAEARSRLYPLVVANGSYTYNGVTRDLTLPRGSIGVLPGATPIPLPQQDLTLFKAKHNLFFGNVLAYQPISQLGKIKDGIKVAETDVALAKTQVSQAELAVRQGVEKLYFGLLIAQRQQQQVQTTIELTQAKLYDVESALLAGKTDPVNKVGLQADLANQQQQLLQLTNQVEDYTADLNELLGQPAETPLNLNPVSDSLPALPELATFLEGAKSGNLEVRQADQTSQKATLGVQAARKDYIPTVGALGGYLFQNVISDLPQSNYFVGLQLSYNIVDFGRRRSALNQRLSQEKQASENVQYTREHIAGEVQKAHRKARQAQSLLPIAAQAAQYRRDELKLKTDRLAAGLALKRDVLETQAALAKAEADLYSAQLAYRLALSDLEALTGISR